MTAPESTATTFADYVEHFPGGGGWVSVAALKEFLAHFPLHPADTPGVRSDEIADYYTQIQRPMEQDRAWRAKHAPDLNIWSGTGLGRDEVRHCRLLTWLFDPHGNHSQGPMFLGCFFDAVGLHEFARFATDCDYTVRAEDTLDSESRVDLRIGNAKFQVWIEAKIDHREGDRQIERYAKLLRVRSDLLGVPASCRKLLYLTPRGQVSRSAMEDVSITWETVAVACDRFAQKCEPRFLGDAVRQFAAYLRMEAAR